MVFKAVEKYMSTVEEIDYRLESCVHYTLSNLEKSTREE
nr:MAG TPA: hypothetical protein [Caudoviricetes sp.]